MERSIQNEKITGWLSAITNGVWLLLAFTFIASGVLKGVAVKGFEITVKEFLDLMGLETLQTYSFFIAVTICLSETAIGFFSVFKRLRPVFSIIFPTVMLFFTIVTYINLTDMYGGIESCGCFGEVIHLGPTESFLKNIFLLALSIIAGCLTKKNFQPL